MLKALFLVALLAVAIYLAIRFMTKKGLDDGGSTARRRPVSPDDDPEFLRDLDRKRREQTED